VDDGVAGSQGGICDGAAKEDGAADECDFQGEDFRFVYVMR
jgi:hypothetical protein